MQAINFIKLFHTRRIEVQKKMSWRNWSSKKDRIQKNGSQLFTIYYILFVVPRCELRSYCKSFVNHYHINRNIKTNKYLKKRDIENRVDSLPQLRLH